MTKFHKPGIEEWQALADKEGRGRSHEDLV